MALPGRVDVQLGILELNKLVVTELKDVLRVCSPDTKTNTMKKSALQDQVKTRLKSGEHKKVLDLINGKLKARESTSNPKSSFKASIENASANQSASSPKVVKFSTAASKILFAPLPFYDIEKTVIEPIILITTQNSSVNKMRTSISFQLSEELIKMLPASMNSSLPRYELQIRMAMHRPGKEQVDAFPVNAVVTMNGKEVTLPQLLRITDPNQAVTSKRDSQPVDLSEYCNRTNGASQKLVIEWQRGAQSFVVGIWLVRHIDFNILCDRFLNDGKAQHAQYDETKQMIKSKLNGNSTNEDISMDSLIISLICPLTRSKMVTPIRSRNCAHIQCFDLNSYLMMNEKRMKWKCPICSKTCPFDSLVIDHYFVEIIKKVGKSVNEVELLTDGNWKLIDKEREIKTNKEAIDLTVEVQKATVDKAHSSDNQNSAKTPQLEVPIVHSSERPETHDSNVANPVQPQIEVIMIDDDDEEPVIFKRPTTRKRPRSEIDSNGITIVTLSDSDDSDSDY